MKSIMLIVIFFVAFISKPQETKINWYKGNTHAHTVLCGHADTHPDTVTMWYLVRDYNFLILRECNPENAIYLRA